MKSEPPPTDPHPPHVLPASTWAGARPPWRRRSGCGSNRPCLASVGRSTGPLRRRRGMAALILPPDEGSRVTARRGPRARAVGGCRTFARFDPSVSSRTSIPDRVHQEGVPDGAASAEGDGNQQGHRVAPGVGFPAWTYTNRSPARPSGARAGDWVRFDFFTPPRIRTPSLHGFIHLP